MKYCHTIVHYCTIKSKTSFFKYQQVIGTNKKYTKGFENYSYICRFPFSSNRCTFGLSNQLTGSFSPATELEFNRSWTSPFEELVWHLNTQVNNSLLAAHITVFGPRSKNSRCFIPCLVYALVYPSIASNLVTLDTLSPWSNSLCTHTCYPFTRKPLLRWPRTV